MSIVEIYHLMQDKATREFITKALRLEHLPDVLKVRFQKLLERVIN